MKPEDIVGGGLDFVDQLIDFVDELYKKGYLFYFLIGIILFALLLLILL